ncbi:Hsp20/alpha crystallin family protein [Actinomycetospora straminea]|uniref:Hsp20/alpha crystallin family protein n=1 Tax=Actinomycetospora straminea TaxID=663607 RepID=A0ABP9EM54_9PSEU|nr:Hsp20/alpha crystallin family protein [Actinomycetospora straminea]MDD7933178.1 Hsp20/alpha crystallin family protein [Actinomycetospora straminea]
MTSGDVFRQFDRMFEDWMRAFPARAWDRPALQAPEEIIKVDEYREDGDLVIKAEIPGIDPEKDLRLTIDNGILDLRAERRITEDTEDKGYHRHELRYGTFARRLPLPEGVDPAGVTASYTDGMLSVRIPMPALEKGPEPTTIPIEKG